MHIFMYRMCTMNVLIYNVVNGIEYMYSYAIAPSKCALLPTPIIIYANLKTRIVNIFVELHKRVPRFSRLSTPSYSICDIVIIMYIPTHSQTQAHERARIARAHTFKRKTQKQTRARALVPCNFCKCVCICEQPASQAASSISRNHHQKQEQTAVAE